MIRNKILIIKAFALVALVSLFAAYSNEDDTTDRGTTLTDGPYPLQIGTVTVTAEVSDGTQTRVAETDDGTGSVFEYGDAITVQLGGETAIYTFNGTD